MSWLGLRDYQFDAIKRMRNGCILCGGVGSGKSRTSIGVYYKKQGGDLYSDEYVPMNDPPQDLYIITTARKRDTKEWEGELTPFLLSTNPKDSMYDHKIVIDSWNNVAKYKDVKGAFFIFDEQRVVGYGTWVKAFLKIAKANDWILLSATPGDTWMDYVPVFIANGFFKNKTEFQQHHVIYSRFVTNFPKIEGYYNTERLIRLRDRILVDMDFKRPTVAHHEDVWCGFDIQLYRSVGKDRWDPFKQEPIINASGLCFVWRKIVNSDRSRQMALLELFEEHPKMIVLWSSPRRATGTRSITISRKATCTRIT